MKNLLTIVCIAGLLASCNNMNKNADNGGSMMNNGNAANNEARMQAFYDQVINAHNVAMVDSFTTTDFVDHSPSPGHSGKGLDDTKTSFQEWFTAFPDVHIKTNWISSRGDTIIAHVTMTGTNTGAMGPNMPATGKAFNIDGVDIVTIKDGKATDRWGYFEDRKMAEQLGMMGDHDNKSETEKAVEEKMDKAKEEGKNAAQKVMPKKK